MFPNLRCLRLCGHDRVRGACFEPLLVPSQPSVPLPHPARPSWRHCHPKPAAVQNNCPNLEELYLVGCRMLDTHIRQLATRTVGPPLRINFASGDPLPPYIDICCGVCGECMFRRVRSYAKAPPSQRHITYGAPHTPTPSAHRASRLPRRRPVPRPLAELYTNEAPVRGAVAPMIGAEDASSQASALGCGPPWLLPACPPPPALRHAADGDHRRVRSSTAGATATRRTGCTSSMLAPASSRFTAGSTASRCQGRKTRWRCISRSSQ